MVLDYQKLGFKCGIEIHQQVDTHKLFCPCPSVIRDECPDVSVERRMRAVAGELGNIDPAALHEFLRGRRLVYEAYRDSNCLVELDEEPPHPVNNDALRICLEVALLLGAKPVDEVHVMRKTVIDGSNTSGFQRTMLVAEDGVLETSLGPVGVPTICLEEDAARIISEEGGVVHYRLDRLGIPLIELATDPVIKSPAHARECAEKIGSILRATKVKRGLGTIRQDINISIADGNRVEVKGVQDLRLISKVVEGEVERQVMLLEVLKRLNESGVNKKDYDIEAVDVTSCFMDTKSNVIKTALDVGGVVLGVRLAGLKGLLKGKFGPQIAQYARAMAGVKGIFHGDELPGYGISPGEVEDIKKTLSIDGSDSFAVVSGPKDQCVKALDAVLNRCRIALDGVPVETRRAKDNGSTEFMRPLPGSSRMYPETDEPLVRVSHEYVLKIKKSLPELREDRAKRYVDLGLSAELANQLSKDGKNTLFEEYAEKYGGVDATTVATTLTSTTKEAEKRYGVDSSNISRRHYDEIFDLISRGVISKNVLAQVIAEVCKNPGKSVRDLASEKGLTTLSSDELEKIVEKIISENQDLNRGQLIGKVMAEVKGRADAKDVADLIKTK
ncbi:MAG: Glu-tRNA(Gln) amidotransferase subunit GatE [Candidatus Altiarchaeota archaeon]|nr:Glu-tRNA(Gln) amidotransferase subunit GatE [Candidatus Altiarchaeota archaeon]